MAAFQAITNPEHWAAVPFHFWSVVFFVFGCMMGSFLNVCIHRLPLGESVVWVGIPNELSYAVAVAQAIPENAPVLVAVDYEPSRTGEMEAAAAPLFDNMLLLKRPRLTFVASNETGAILAERFMAGPLVTHNYQTEVTYLNLGYLSGGQMGVRAFAQTPSIAAPLDIYG